MPVILRNLPTPFVELRSADSQMEDAILALASHVFLQTPAAPACLDALKRLFGAVRFQYLLLLLAFVRAAHYWTKVHPEIEFAGPVLWRSPGKTCRALR